MKTMIAAFIFFALLCYGLHDVKSYKASLRKVTRRIGKGSGRTGPIVPDHPPEDPRALEAPLSRRYR